MGMYQGQTFFQKKSIRALVLGVLVWMIVVLLPEAFFAPFRAVLAPVAAPLQGFISWAAFETGDVFHFFSSISDLKQENERLERERSSLLREVAGLQESREENRLLREALRLPALISPAALSAEVISRDMSAATAGFTVNRGTTDGVELGFPVVVGENLVGRISATYLTSAEVRLLSHPESTVAARVAGSSVQGVIRGDHSLGLVFDMALSGVKLETGAILVTSGIGDGLPKELMIGRIHEVRPSLDRLFQQATLTIPTAFEDIRFVSILLAPAV
jgi:rod shape-determining protein MreC